MQQSPHQSGPTEATGARLFIARLLETFFRRWWLYLLPVALLGALGVATVLGKGTSYRVLGRHLRQPGFVVEPDHRGRGENSFGFDNPATYTSRQINTLLGTDVIPRFGDRGRRADQRRRKRRDHRRERAQLHLGSAQRRRVGR